MKYLLAAVVFVSCFASCWLFDQKPVCPPSHPKCWQNDPAIDNDLREGAKRDAGPETDAS